MKTTLYAKELVDTLLEGNYPGSFHNPDDKINEHSYNVELLIGNGDFREIFFDGVCISYGNTALKNDTVLHFENSDEMVQMHFTLCGNVVTHAGPLKNFRLGYNQHNIIYDNRLKGRSELAAKQNISIFAVSLLPSFFSKYLPEEPKVFQSFARKLNKKQSGVLTGNNLRVTSQMHLIIGEILSCKRVGIYKRMFIEAKVTELLMLQLEQMSAYEGEVFCSLKKSDIEKIHAARDIILKNAMNPVSLSDLTKMVCTNEFTLKKGFKELFGTTVFGLVEIVRMEHAKKMLVDQRFTVREVSELVGYKYPQHFSYAFKKYFGNNPSRFKSQIDK
ncbi:MAG: AraC family transcriptional regulator [Bacteroidota bacterium]